MKHTKIAMNLSHCSKNGIQESWKHRQKSNQKLVASSLKKDVKKFTLFPLR